MKLNKRESILIVLMVSVLIIYLLYSFLFKPVLEELSVNNDDIASKQVTLEEIKNQIKLLDQFDDDDRALLAEIKNQSESFLPTLKNKEIMNYLGSITTETGVNITRINVESMELINLNKNDQTKDAGYSAALIANNIALLRDGTEDSTDNIAVIDPWSSLIVETIKTEISFTNTGYDNIMGFIKRVESLNKYIIIDGIDFSLADNGTLQGSINMTFYGIRKIEDETSPLDFTEVSPVDKFNPFG